MKDHDLGCSSFDGVPLDFTEFLSQRLNAHPSDVIAMLGECLVQYEPRERYEIVVGPDTRAA